MARKKEEAPAMAGLLIDSISEFEDLRKQPIKSRSGIPKVKPTKTKGRYAPAIVLLEENKEPVIVRWPSGENFRVARVQVGMTQAELAETSIMTQSSIARIERLRGPLMNVDPPNLVRILDVFFERGLRLTASGEFEAIED